MSEFSQQSFRVRVVDARPSRVNRAVPQNRAHRLSILAVATAGFALMAGCGSNLRPTVIPITGTGPGSQPTANTFVISRPISSTTAQGYGTVIDYSGDTIMATAPIGPGPNTFALNSGGAEAFTLNVDGTLSNIPVSTSLQTKNVHYSTLNPIPAAGATSTDPAGIDPVVALFSGSTGLYALDVNLNQIDVLTGSSVFSFNRDVPVAQTPVTAAGVSGATRFYTVSQNIPYLTPITLDGKQVDGGVACNIDPHSSDLSGSLGTASAIETASYTISAQIPLGVCPIYAIATPDARRVFVLNRGSDTITVINSQNNALDSCVCPATGCQNQSGQTYTCHPTFPLSTSAVTATGISPPNLDANLPSVAGPVYAEYNAAKGELIVSNYDGSTINIIDVSLDIYGNDSATFGTTYTVPVGANPASVTVLADGSRAYTANQTDSTVSIVDMSSRVVVKTLPVTGNPRTVVSTANSIFGKVYVASPNSSYVTIIRTDQDIIDTTVLVQGNTVDLRVTSPDTSATNPNLVSRLPGAGQPCFLPPSAFTSTTPLTLANCKAQDPSLLTSATVTTVAPALRK
jgi:YVTN family beta-propeller protein